jgi:nitrogen regulatory protein P-II 1
MKKIEAFVRSERFSMVRDRLRELGIGGIITSVSGWTKGRELHMRYRGRPVSRDLIAGAKFELFVPDDMIDLVVKTITETARTGKLGDGVIAVSNLEKTINITTLEDGGKSFSPQP